MHRFEKAEAEELAERKALLEKPEDDDGFVTVTHKRKRGRNSSTNGTPSDGEGVTADGAKKKRKGAGELSDFYRFQVCVCVHPLVGVPFVGSGRSFRDLPAADAHGCTRELCMWWYPW